jgi:hypothetical protein
LNVGKSGTEGNLITVTKGIDANHNGKVIFQGSGSGTGILIENKQWIIVKDMTINDWAIGVRIDGGSADAVHNVVIDNIDGRMAGRFVFIEGWPDQTGLYAHDITVKNCDVTTGTDVSTQTDFVYAQYMKGLTIENNHVVISNENPSQHCDQVQTLWVDGPVVVKNNYFEHADHKAKNSQGIFFENYEGTYEVLNNVVVQYNDNLDSKIYFKSSTLNNAHTIITGNTVYGSSGDLIYSTDVNAVIKNNIVVSTGFIATGTSCMVRGATFGAGSDINNNLYYDPTNTMTNVCGGNQGANSLETNPEFVNIATHDFKLQSTSPAIDAGVTLETPYNFDRDGVYRPQGTAWDIGAYEYVGGTVSCVSVSPADNSPCDGCISLGEISEYVNLWLSNQGVTLENVSGAVNLWIGGC